MMIQIRAIVLLLVFTFSNVGTAMEFHYCDGELTGVGLVGQLDCHCLSDLQTDCCQLDKAVELEHLNCDRLDHEEHEGHAHVDHSDCCQSDVVDMSSSELMVDYYSFSSPIVTLFVWANFLLFEETIENEILIVEEDEQLPSIDKQVLFQTFLI